MVEALAITRGEKRVKRKFSGGSVVLKIVYRKRNQSCLGESFWRGIATNSDISTKKIGNMVLERTSSQRSVYRRSTQRKKRLGLKLLSSRGMGGGRGDDKRRLSYRKLRLFSKGVSGWQKEKKKKVAQLEVRPPAKRRGL